MRVPPSLLSVLVVACTAAPARPSETPTRPERLVLVVGESSDALGIEQARDPSGDSIAVALHDGTRTWVESWRVRDLELVPGSRVVVRRSGELVVTTLVERVDRMAWVGVEGGPSLIALSDVVAVLRRGEITGATGPTPPDATPPPPPPPPPPIDPARVVTFDGPSMWAVGRLASCEDGSATVLMPDGHAPVSVPFDRIAPIAFEAGDRVFAPWQGTTYPAMILETRAGMVHVQWEDESEAWMPGEEIRRVLREPPAAGRAGRRPAACVRRSAPVLVHLGRLRSAAVIESCAEGRAVLVRHDGSHDARPLGELARAAVENGDVIEAEWRDSAVYTATVLAVIGPTLRVRWEDGSEEEIAIGTLVSVLEPARSQRAREPAVCP